MCTFVKMAKRTSAVWEFFQEPELVNGSEDGKKVKKVRCKLCDVRLADGGGTTNLLNHLSSKHPVEHERINAGNNKPTSSKQMLLTGLKRCSPQRSAEITNKIVEFIALDLKPLRTVDGIGFRRFLEFIEPGYKIPSRTHVRTMCQKRFEELKDVVAASLTDQFVSLTTDIWTSRATQAYLTITSHFITKDWKMQSSVLQTREMPERHTGVNISERLLEATREWKLSADHIVSVVHDNAANVVLALELVEELHSSRCFAHTFQLAVNSGLDLRSIDKLTSICRKIVGHFKHSVVASEALKEKQRSLQIPEHHLLQDVRTRWNSTYFMYDRLDEQRWAIFAVIHDKLTPASQQHLDLTPDQWELLHQMVNVLKPLQMTTTVMCTDRDVSASLVYPLLNGLLNHHLSASSNDLQPVQKFKETVANELKKRFKFDPTNVMVLACAVDPRYHHLNSFKVEERLLVQQQLKDVMRDKYSCSESLEEPPAKKRNMTAMSFLLGEDHSTQSTGWMAEYENFLKEPQTHHDDDALEWWSRNEKRFPVIAKLAQYYLSVPATSVPSERIFSTAGLILNEKRSCLHPETADVLIFLNKNLPVQRP